MADEPVTLSDQARTEVDTIRSTTAFQQGDPEATDGMLDVYRTAYGAPVEPAQAATPPRPGSPAAGSRPLPGRTGRGPAPRAKPPAPTPASGDDSPEDLRDGALATIAEYRSDPNHPIHHPGKPGHADALLELEELYKLAHPDATAEPASLPGPLPPAPQGQTWDEARVGDAWAQVQQMGITPQDFQWCMEQLAQHGARRPTEAEREEMAQSAQKVLDERWGKDRERWEGLAWWFFDTLPDHVQSALDECGLTEHPDVIQTVALYGWQRWQAGAQEARTLWRQTDKTGVTSGEQNDALLDAFRQTYGGR